MKLKGKNISHIKLRDKYVERKSIVECLACGDIFTTKMYKSHPCIVQYQKKSVNPLTKEEESIFEDIGRLERLLDIKPVVNFLWKHPNMYLKQIKEKRRNRK